MNAAVVQPARAFCAEEAAARRSTLVGRLARDIGGSGVRVRRRREERSHDQVSRIGRCTLDATVLDGKLGADLLEVGVWEELLRGEDLAGDR